MVHFDQKINTTINLIRGYPMHEMALMGDILILIEQDASNNAIDKVEEIELIVGELCNAMPEALEMAFDLYKSSEPAFLNKDAKLVLIKEEAKACCTICGTEYHPEQRIALCPKCDFPSGELISGETFKVNSYKGSARI